MSRVKKNTYQVVWEHAETGGVHTSAEIDAPIHGDVVVEHIHVLTQFHAIFQAPPDCVKRIVEVKLVREDW